MMPVSNWVYLQPSEPKPDFLDLFRLQVFQGVALEFFNLLGWGFHSCRFSLGVRQGEFCCPLPVSSPARPAIPGQERRACGSLSPCAPGAAPLDPAQSGCGSPATPTPGAPGRQLRKAAMAGPLPRDKVRDPALAPTESTSGLI
jgi:hypothetical protein